jgi:hypothetical protein
MLYAGFLVEKTAWINQPLTHLLLSSREKKRFGENAV